MERETANSRSGGVFVSSVLVRMLVEAVQRRGIAPEALLGTSASSLLSEPANLRIPLDEFQALLARAVELTAEPALGLHCGLLASDSSFGLMTPLVSYSASLREAIALVAQFSGLVCDALRIELTEHTGTARLQCKLHSAMSQSVNELIAAGLVRALKSFGCVDSEIRTVNFEYKHPAHHHAYRVAFGGSERFAQPFTGIEFAARALDRPHMHWQPGISAVMRTEAERAMQRLSRPLSCSERVRTFLSGQRTPQVPDMNIAARELGLSVRSLRRRLEREGTSYRELSQSATHAWACTMLRNPALTLQSIAHALGFADPSSFHRAFTRWAGQTPLEYREAQQASHAGIAQEAKRAGAGCRPCSGRGECRRVLE